jgi:mono/diheme cytochrome c family protein
MKANILLLTSLSTAAAAIVAIAACSGDDTTTTPPPNDASTDHPIGMMGGDAAVDADASAIDAPSGIDADAGRDTAVPIDASEGGVAIDASDGGPVGDADAQAPLSFSADIWPAIIAQRCIACHGMVDGGPGIGITIGNLDMGDAAAGFVNLVGDGGGVLAQGMAAGAGGVTCAAAAADAGLKRVLPNDALHSLIWDKVASKEDGGPAVICGNPMPAVGAPLDPAQVAAIQAWINEGAHP